MPDKFFRSSVHADLSEVPGIDTSVAHIARDDGKIPGVLWAGVARKD